MCSAIDLETETTGCGPFRVDVKAVLKDVSEVSLQSRVQKKPSLGLKRNGCAQAAASFCELAAVRREITGTLQREWLEIEPAQLSCSVPSIEIRSVSPVPRVTHGRH